MREVTEFFIGFNNDRKVFYPGELLQGYVVVNLKQPMEMNGIKLDLEGEAQCRWTEKRSSGDTQRYNGHESIFSTSLWLFNNGHSRVTHNAGRFTYQFSFQLPPKLPSSFEGSYGYIRYILEAQIDRPWAAEPRTKLPLIINEVIDTNLLEYARGPRDEENKEAGCFCCAGPLHLSASIDRACYCPGETILVTAHVDNSTPQDMAGLTGKIVQTIIYASSDSYKHESETVSRIYGPAILKGNHADWKNKPLPVPACLPTIECNILAVHYNVVLEVEVPWSCDDVTLVLPITMGTVPYRATYGQPAAYPPPPNQPVQNEFALNPMPPNTPYPPSTNAALPPPPPHLSGYPDMAPPSYAAVVGGQAVNTADGNDDKHTFGETSYLPIYTYVQPHQSCQPPPSGAPSQSNPPPTAQLYPPQPGVPITRQPQAGFSPPGYPRKEVTPTAPEKK